MTTSLRQQIIGNDRALSLIEKLAKLGRNHQLSGAYIITGHDKVVTARAADWLFRALACLQTDSYPCGSCRHCQSLGAGLFPDLYQLRLEADKQAISLEQIKDLITRLSFSALAGGYRFVVIHNAESLSTAAANGLLKTLEEPGARIVIVLLASDSATLPATIVSRSQMINFRQVSSNVIFDHLVKSAGLKRSLAKSIAHLSMGKFGLTESYLSDEALYQERVCLAERFLEVLASDLSIRLRFAEELSKETAKATKASAFLPVFQTVIRDLLMLNLNQPDLIHNDSLRTRLDECRGRFGLKRLVEASKHLAQARLYLATNVNSQLVLENLLINL